MEKGQRIAKVIARSGLCSRREAEELITQGRVMVNKVAIDSPALNVTSSDTIKVDGERLPALEKTRLWLYHKPTGLITTHKDDQQRKTVFETLPDKMPRVISIGRLDLNSEGLLLLTNDGALSRNLELPSTKWVRRYKVKVTGIVNEKKLADLKNGIEVDGIRYGSIDVQIENQSKSITWLIVSLSEGKNREIRKVMAHLGLTVARLIRLSYGPFQLGGLNRGELKEIPYKILKEQLGKLLED